MKMHHRWLRRVMALPLLLFPLTDSGCTIRLGSFDDMGGSEPPSGSESPSGSEPPTSILPTPINAPADEFLFENEAERARWEESEWYTVNIVYQGGTPVHAFQLPSGDIVDFVARSTLPGLPYNLSELLPDLPLSLDSVTLPPGVEFGLTEFEQVPELAELLADTVPFLRPTFWPYILGDAPDAASIEDYLARYQVGGHEGGQLSGIDRLYAGLASKEPNRGISGLMNQFHPKVEDDSFSLLEFAVFCPAEGIAQEMVGVVISVDRENGFGLGQYKLPDDKPRLHIEYANAQAGYVWDGMDATFIGNPFRVHHPGQKVPVSVVDGMQVEHLMGIFQAPGTGDWWIMYKGDLLGYYPASLFTMLNNGACGSAWYGEVYNPAPGKAVETEMGSGRFPEAGKFKTAYVREPKYYDLLWNQEEPQDLVSMTPHNPLCYDRAPLTGGVLRIGGPGSFNQWCQWP